ncbi:hypothetical protein CFP56_038900 [Quercus suber]|uniref:Uncharacterized protein n=1 Tax=Quercus suber TaxID=58331 RepID=A0AAW0J1T9_QUESU
MWSQRSRVLWLSEGDSNSKYFHNKATHKHRKNTILGIRDKWGRWQDQPNGIRKTLIDFYGELLTTSSLVLLLKTLGYAQQMVSTKLKNASDDSQIKYKAMAFFLLLSLKAISSSSGSVAASSMSQRFCCLK